MAWARSLDELHPTARGCARDGPRLDPSWGCGQAVADTGSLALLGGAGRLATPARTPARDENRL